MFTQTKMLLILFLKYKNQRHLWDPAAAYPKLERLCFRPGISVLFFLIVIKTVYKFPVVVIAQRIHIQGLPYLIQPVNQGVFMYMQKLACIVEIKNWPCAALP